MPSVPSGFRYLSAHVDPYRLNRRYDGEQDEQDGVDGAQPSCLGPADAKLAGDQKKREGHADRDGEAADDVSPDKLDSVLTRLDDHEDRDGEPEQHDVDRERPGGGRDFRVVEEVE